ncbi:hypothetical protein BS78_08G028900 [Paspalum vaginatum]|nr:hypothetical protein BS78_08G028900 [Paspalum vaginatum]
MSDDQRQCRRGGISTDVELGAALALADMAGVAAAIGPAGAKQEQEEQAPRAAAAAGAEHHQMTTDEDEEEMVSTRLSLQLGRAEKDAKRLRRVLANGESSRQTIIGRQAFRDELVRKVADLSSQNESMKKEKDLVMEEYLSLKETNEQLKVRAQAQAHHHLSLSLF